MFTRAEVGGIFVGAACAVCTPSCVVFREVKWKKISEQHKVVEMTHLSIKEDSHTLFGFAEREERELFRHLISVSGVGPNTAQMILSSLSPEDAQQAILAENVSILKSVKGIGGKTAQRIILDLKDKLSKQGIIVEQSFAKHNTTREEALSALTMLGLSLIHI